MNNIEVAILEEHGNPGQMMMFLAKLTQRGHSITCMKDLMDMYENTCPGSATIERVAKLPHGTIKRFTPITVAIVGASRRFLAQARTHQVGFNYVSASLQYSDYTDKGRFVVPYPLIEATHNGETIKQHTPTEYYLRGCEDAMVDYRRIAQLTDNDTAGYAAPQGLRNILVLQANHESWMNFIRARSCNRNTVETQYVTLRIWEELLKTTDGVDMFAYAGPDCMWGVCREGKMCCGKPLKAKAFADCPVTLPRAIINNKWPLLT